MAEFQMMFCAMAFYFGALALGGFIRLILQEEPDGS